MNFSGNILLHLLSSNYTFFSQQVPDSRFTLFHIDVHSFHDGILSSLNLIIPYIWRWYRVWRIYFQRVLTFNTRHRRGLHDIAYSNFLKQHCHLILPMNMMVHTCMKKRTHSNINISQFFKYIEFLKGVKALKLTRIKLGKFCCRHLPSLDVTGNRYKYFVKMIICYEPVFKIYILHASIFELINEL